MDPLIPLLVADLQEEDYDLEDEIGKLAEHVGWNNVLKEVMHILDRPSKRAHWYQAASITYWAVSDGIEFPYPREEWIARLYYCLEVFPEHGEPDMSNGSNLVWSIATKLMGLGYNSDWEPLTDQDVVGRMSRMRAAG